MRKRALNRRKITDLARPLGAAAKCVARGIRQLLENHDCISNT